MLPKAEIHVHLEGTMPPSLVKTIAKRNELQVPEEIIGPNDTFQWDDFLHFLEVYDIASQVLRTRQDYRDMTYDYLARSAQQGVIYTEMMISPDHAANCGVSYEDHLLGAAAGIDDARRDHGIEGRLIITGVRHFGFEKVLNVARQTVDHPHPYVVGFGLGGDEAGFPAGQFEMAYKIVDNAGLPSTVHAGEFAGPDSVWDAINNLPVTRIGHGVRSVEDPSLINKLVRQGITLEVCPGSNISLGVYPDFANHPFNRLRQAGIKVTLNSDDPPYFATTIGREYEIAQEHFGLNDEELLNITRATINNSFANDELKQELLNKLDES